MKLPVLTAVTDSVWEAGIVAAFEADDVGVSIVRRCVDLPDLLATAAAGVARAALLSSDLRRLDRDAITRLAASRVAVVALTPPGDEAADRRLRQLGVTDVLPADAAPRRIADAVSAAVSAIDSRPRGSRRSPTADDDLDSVYGDAAADFADVVDDVPAGRVVAVWGPAGAPGRTTVAVTLAAELAAAGAQTMLVDADPYGGVVAQTLGLLDEAPGLAAAARLANAGTLDVPSLAGVARQLSPTLRVLTGISRAERWPELRAASLEVVFSLASRLVTWTVIDCGFSIEQDEELAYDTTVPRRNAATITALTMADTVVVVGSADPVSLQRLVRALSDLGELLPGVTPLVVINRSRASLMRGDVRAEVTGVLDRYAGVRPAAFVPLDVKALDAALMTGRSLTEAAPGSPARQAVTQLARTLIGNGQPARRSRLRARR